MWRLNRTAPHLLGQLMRVTMVMAWFLTATKMRLIIVDRATYPLLCRIPNKGRNPSQKILFTLWRELDLNRRFTGGQGAEARRRNTRKEAGRHLHHQRDTSTILDTNPRLSTETHQGQNLLFQRRNLVVLPASQSHQVLGEVWQGPCMEEASRSSMRLIEWDWRKRRIMKLIDCFMLRRERRNWRMKKGNLLIDFYLWKWLRRKKKSMN